MNKNYTTAHLPLLTSSARPPLELQALVEAATGHSIGTPAIQEAFLDGHRLHEGPEQGWKHASWIC